ncbi:MAG: hypothetical protein ACT4TC_07525 [Myxococcaceae bacterium]
MAIRLPQLLRASPQAESRFSVPRRVTAALSGVSVVSGLGWALRDIRFGPDVKLCSELPVIHDVEGHVLNPPSRLPGLGGKCRAPSDAERALWTALEGGKADPNTQRDIDTMVDAPDVGGTLRAEALNAMRAASAKVVPEENIAVTHLSPTDRQQYVALKTYVGNDLRTMASLQVLLLNEKLPGVLLSRLSQLSSSAPLAQGIDRGELVRSLLQEMATPSAINQRNKNTCGPTAVGMDLAERDSTKYFDVIAGLASPSGEYLMPGGGVLARMPNTIPDDHSGRPITQRLVQPAMMNVANEKGGYVNATDKNAGSTPDGLAFLMSGLYERPMRGERVIPFVSADDGVDVVRAEVEAGRPAVVGIHWSFITNHQVAVKDFYKVGEQEFVLYLNPQGRVERMTLEDFQGRLTSVEHEGLEDKVGLDFPLFWPGNTVKFFENF